MTNHPTKYYDCHIGTIRVIWADMVFAWKAWPISLSSTMTVTHKLFKILSGHGFCIKWYCDLDLWPCDLNIYRGHLLTMTNLSTKVMTVTHKLFTILSGHGYCIKWYYDLDLWPCDLKIYRGHLLTMTNLPTKYHDCHS